MHATKSDSKCCIRACPPKEGTKLTFLRRRCQRLCRTYVRAPALPPRPPRSGRSREPAEPTFWNMSLRQYRRLCDPAFAQEPNDADVLSYPDGTLPVFQDKPRFMPGQCVETKVGGAGECWKKLYRRIDQVYNEHTGGEGYWESERKTMTLREFVHWICEAIAFFPETAADDYIVMTRQPDGDLHLESVHLEYVPGSFSCKEFVTFVDPELERFFDVENYMAATDFENSKPNELFCSPSFMRPTYVGLEASGMVEASQAANQQEIARQEANNLFNEELKAMPTCQLRLNVRDRRLLKRRLGYDVRYTNSSKNFSGHAVLAAERALARDSLMSQYDRNDDVESALHVGCTMHEISKWWSHAGHDFLFNVVESKDILRVSQQIVKMLGKRLKDAGLGSLTSRKGNVTRLNNLTLEECLQLLETGGRRRIFFEIEDLRCKYNVLFFEDCMYDMSEEQFMRYFRVTGAKRAHAINFTPDFMVSKFAPRSELYYHEQVLPAEDRIRDAIEMLWPEILLAANLLPGHAIQTHITKFLHWLLRQGVKVLLAFLCKPLGHGNLVDQFFGLMFELSKVRPIILSIFEKVGQTFYDLFSDTKITWKSGAGNGYRHSTRTWRAWIHKRRFQDAYGLVESEVREMHGEMWITDFYISNGNRPLTYSVTLPPHKSTVLVMDVYKSYTKGVGFNERPEYIPVAAEDWHRILNWGLAEPLESLDFGVMMTTINRVRGGLKLGTNEIVAPMDLESDEVKSIALAALCEISQVRSVSSVIESDKELRDGYQSTVKELAKMAFKVGLAVLTNGLAVPIWFFLRWLISESKSHEWYKAPTRPKLISLPATSSVRTARSDLDGISLVLPHVEPKTRNPCFTCQMYEAGKFSMSGRPEEGQQFRCSNHELTGVRSLQLRPDHVTGIISRIRDAIQEHTVLGAGPKLIASMKRMQEWFEGQEGMTLSHDVKCHLHVGGPGVGKSTCYRAMAKALQSVGKKVVVLSPFSKLLDDYKEQEVIGWKGLHSFEANTFWWMSKESNVDSMLADEASNIDELLLAAMVVYTGTKELYLAGDPDQTHLNAEAGEGIDPLNEQHPHEFFDPKSMPRHDYVWNWRNKASIVKLLNHRIGYKMQSKSTDYSPPLFLTREQYANYRLENAIDREMVFSHKSCDGIFGMQSMQNPKEDNHSVRSEQGMTHKTVALGVSALDAATIEITGMRCVAISRQTGDLVCVAENWNDAQPARFKEWLCCDDPEKWKEIMAKPWPVFEEEVSNHELTRDQAYLDRMVRKLAKSSKVVLEKEQPNEEEDTQMTTLALEPIRGFVDVNDPYIAIVEDRPLETFYNKAFATCFFDIVRSELQMHDEVYQFLEKTYFSERVGLNAKTEISISNGPKPMIKDKNGKYVFWLSQIEDFCQQVDISLLILDKNGNRLHANDIWKKRKETKRELVLQYHASHVEPAIVLDTIFQDVHVNPLHFVNGKRYMDVIFDRRAERERKEQSGLYSKRNLDLENVMIGYTNLEPVALSREHYREATRHCEQEGVRGLEKPKPWSYEKLPHISSKLRTGTDAFKLAKWVDPSDNLPWNNMSEPHVVDPVTEEVKATYIPEGLLGFSKTKAGKLRKEPYKVSRSFTKGYANVYDGSTMETISASQRLGMAVEKPALTGETMHWAKQVANKFVNECMDRNTPKDVEVYNGILRGALADVKRRNYGGRADAERKKDPLEEKRIMVANKSQIKFKMPIDPMKPGQPLSMPNTKVSLNFVPYFRTLGYRFKECANDNVFIDDFESGPAFAQRLTKAIDALPDGVKFLIVDAEKFDSQQGPVTCYIEKCIHEALGAESTTLEEYYEIRASGISWNLLGRMKGKMSGNKPSGLADTKLGNSLVEAALAHYKYEGLGPWVMAIKGDDYLRVQAAIKVNEQHAAEIKQFTGLRLVEKLADSGSFIGYAVSKKGVVPDVVKRTYKALAARSRDYKHFCEQQQAYRDLVEEVRILGGEKAAELGAVAIGASETMGAACWAIMNSLSHINKAQWISNTRQRISNIGLCPTFYGPRLI